MLALFGLKIEDLHEITRVIMRFFAIFIGIPFIEILLFMTVGQSIGFFTTLLIAFLTAIIGGMLVKYQGLHTLAHIQAAIRQGQLPASELFDGICLLIAGAVLITPGFLTDFIGFSLLVPAVRNVLREALQHHIGFDQPLGGAMGGQQSYQDGNNAQTHSPDIIEGDYERMDDHR